MKHGNPLPILHEYFGLKKSAILRLLGYHRVSPDRLQSLVTQKTLKPAAHAKLFKLAMVNWGTCSDRNIRKLLWACYFPEDTMPHVYHLLSFVHCIEDRVICEKAGIAQSTLTKILRQPKLKQNQLRAIGKFAMDYRNALASRRQTGGVDPRYMQLHRAIHDPKRLYEPGEIIAD